MIIINYNNWNKVIVEVGSLYKFNILIEIDADGDWVDR